MYLRQCLLYLAVLCLMALPLATAKEKAPADKDRKDKSPTVYQGKIHQVLSVKRLLVLSDATRTRPTKQKDGKETKKMFQLTRDAKITLDALPVKLQDLKAGHLARVYVSMARTQDDSARDLTLVTFRPVDKPIALIADRVEAFTRSFPTVKGRKTLPKP